MSKTYKLHVDLPEEYRKALEKLKHKDGRPLRVLVQQALRAYLWSRSVRIDQ